MPHQRFQRFDYIDGLMTVEDQLSAKGLKSLQVRIEKEVFVLSTIDIIVIAYEIVYYL